MTLARACWWGLLLLFPASPRAVAQATVVTGLEVEGLLQSLGEGALLAGDAPPGGTPDDVIESLRVRERETALLGVVGLELRGPWGAWMPSLESEVKAAEKRAAASADLRWSPDPRRARGFSIESLFLWEDDREEARASAQELLYLRWKRPLRDGAWQLSARGTFDCSWASGDSLAPLFNYRRASLRAGLDGTGADGPSLFVEFGRKWVAENGSGEYRSLAASAARAWTLSAGRADLEARVERREYFADPDAADSSAVDDLAAGSFWEADLLGAWGRMLGPVIMDLRCDLSASRHDREGAASAEPSALYRDRWQAETEFLLSRDVLAGRGPREELGMPVPLGEEGWARWLGSLLVGLGPTGQWIDVRGGAGDCSAYGARLEVAARGGTRLGELWVEFGAEAGRREYRHADSTWVFDLEGIGFSLAQTDYRFYTLSAIGGGRLPLGLEWEAYYSCDRERHTDPADSGRLTCFSLSLRRRFDLRSGSPLRSAALTPRRPGAILPIPDAGGGTSLCVSGSRETCSRTPASSWLPWR